jgi:dihydrofolate reductase
MTVSLIVAMSENGVIGRAGTMPWHLSADLRRFKRLTMRHHIIMGRRTFESIGRSLPGRTSIVVSSTARIRGPRVLVAPDVPAALALASDDVEPFVIGGGQVYAAALPLVDRIYATIIHARISGDVFFPEIDWSRWQLIDDQRYAAKNGQSLAFSFRVYARTHSPDYSRRVGQDRATLGGPSQTE